MQITDTGTQLEYEEDGRVAQLTYRIADDRLVMEHTEVPDELGGRGIGSALVQAAVERARSDGVGIVAECPFASVWLRRHADEVKDLDVRYVEPEE